MSFPFSGRIAHEPDLNARSAMADESIIDEESSLFGSLLNAASRYDKKTAQNWLCFRNYFTERNYGSQATPDVSYR